MPIDVELFDELLKRAAQSPVASHAPVTDADVLRTQLADIDRERQAEMRPGSGPLLTGDPSQLNEALGSMIGQPSGAILAPNSMIRNPEVRSRLHEMLMESAEGFAPHIKQALGDFVTRYPRIAAHIPTVEKIAQRIDARAPMGGSLTPLLSPNANPRGVLGLSEKLKDYKAAEKTIAHEATHAADMIKQAGAARRAGHPDPETAEGTPFLQLYNFMNRVKGYWDNPAEVRARVTSELRDIHRKDMPAWARWDLARERAADKVRFDERFQRDFGAKPGGDLQSQVDELINHAVNTSQTIRPLPLGARVEVLDNFIEPSWKSQPTTSTIRPIKPVTTRQVEPTAQEVEDLIQELMKRTSSLPAPTGR